MKICMKWVFLFVLLVHSLPALAADKADLQAAYKKEFAFLDAERRNMQMRLKKLQDEGDERIRSAERELNTLQSKLLGLSAQADGLSDRLLELDRDSEQVGEKQETLLAVFQQAQRSLAEYDVKVQELDSEKPELLLENIPDVYAKAAVLLGQLNTVRRQEGEFFLQDGTLEKGDLILIGNVASYGVGTRGAGALAPVGDGRLKIWPEATEEVARDFAAGEIPQTLNIFLYDTKEKSIEPKEGKTALAVIESGGVIAWVIVFMGLITLVLVLLRILFLSRAASNTDELIARVSPLIEQGWREEAIELCKQRRGATARVLVATIKHLDTERENLEDIVSEQILHETPYLERFGAIILVLAAVAPLMGLLGTVTGMISTFDIITEFGTGDPKMLSGGISEALVTTELGLIVAIPALLFGNLLSGWANRIKVGMEQAALKLINVYVLYGEPRSQMVGKSEKTNRTDKTVSVETSQGNGAGA